MGPLGHKNVTYHCYEKVTANLRKREKGHENRDF